MKKQVRGQRRLILLTQQASGTRAWLSDSQLSLPQPCLASASSVILKVPGLTHLTSTSPMAYDPATPTAGLLGFNAPISQRGWGRGGAQDRPSLVGSWQGSCPGDRGPRHRGAEIQAHGSWVPGSWPEAKVWQGMVSTEGWAGPCARGSSGRAVGLTGAGSKVQDQAPGPRDWDSLAWPSWHWGLLCTLSWVVGSAPRAWRWGQGQASGSPLL